jgi:hypothetical protein
MTEAAFPLLGVAFIVLVVLPVLALGAKLGLMLLERGQAGGPLHNLNLRYLLLTGPSVFPLAWFFSAGLHQAEEGQSALACLLDHGTAALCFEPALFALTLVLVVLVTSLPALRGVRHARPLRSTTASSLRARIGTIVAAHPALSDLSSRVEVTEQPGFTVGTYGLLRPRVYIGARFASGLSDSMLASALGHEGEHVRLLDPLRYLVLRLALALNPVAGFLLERHASRWQAARESHCDREAVILGALPLALADAIIRAARPGAHEVVALGARDTTILKFRIGMLMAFAERKPTRCCHGQPSAFPMTFMLLALALLLPHQTGTAALDALHAGAEHTIAYFWP